MRNEPAIMMGIARALVAALAYFGLDLPEGVVLGAVLALEPIFTAVVRQMSTPNAKVEQRVQEKLKTIPPA